jgi:hypothetical protein
LIKPAIIVLTARRIEGITQTPIAAILQLDSI